MTELACQSIANSMNKVEVQSHLHTFLNCVIDNWYYPIFKVYAFDKSKPLGCLFVIKKINVAKGIQEQ